MARVKTRQRFRRRRRPEGVKIAQTRSESTEAGADGRQTPQARQRSWEIGEELVISVKTVGNHVSNILNKTGAANRTEAATYAGQHGLATPSSGGEG